MKYGERVLLKEYKNGNKLFGTVTRCAKCGGCGKVIWSYANGVCFDCNGKGWYYVEDREYSPKEAAKREKKLAKERAAFEAAEAERAKREAEIAAEEARKEAERLAEIERNRGHFVGNVGDKIEITVTLARNADISGTTTAKVGTITFPRKTANALRSKQRSRRKKNTTTSIRPF